MKQEWYYLMYKSPEDGRLYAMRVEDYDYLMSMNVECMLFNQSPSSHPYSEFNKNDKNIDIMLGMGDLVQVVKYLDDTEEKVTIVQVILCILFWTTVFLLYCYFSK